MYIGMGFMLATIWVHLGYSTNKLNDRLSVSFFSVAFLAFVSPLVANYRKGPVPLIRKRF